MVRNDFNFYMSTTNAEGLVHFINSQALITYVVLYYMLL